ncbi:hypothetical protein HJB72_28425 [Rhizobium lentis]|uniref:hypothetical protein n=1 Tax=Rhizobium lentis TaxID=1138194 RepID=UPI001C8299E5|nr:hypothetical protein [Rhizobium lentis]MBX5001851.1 hypothetical protein [Rhizobium lentis]
MRGQETYKQHLAAHYLADVLLMKYAQEASIGAVNIQNDSTVAAAFEKVAASLGYRVEQLTSQLVAAE